MGMTARILGAATAFSLMAGVVQAAPILHFGQTASVNTVTGTAAGGVTTISAVDVPITITQINAAVATPTSALLDLTLTSTDAAVIGPPIMQHFSGSFSITSGATNYLSGTMIDIGIGVGDALSILASTPPDGQVTFTSDVITTLGLQRAASFALTNVTPAVHIEGGTIASFAATISGDFSAGAIPVPEPAALGLLGLGLVGLGMVRRRHG